MRFLPPTPPALPALPALLALTALLALLGACGAKAGPTTAADQEATRAANAEAQAQLEAQASAPAAGGEVLPQEPAFDWMAVTDEEWRERLTEEQFEVTRRAGTERAHTGAYHDTKTDGSYHCICCDLELFDSKTKFDSGTGWPSFWEPVQAEAVSEHVDEGFFSVRTEIRCARCDAHLGHVFNDGPQPTGKRYCMNSAALVLAPREQP